MVIIKSYQGGLSIHVNDSQPFETLIVEIAKKFEESRKFFKNAAVAISVEGRTLSPEEEIVLIQTIEEHSDLEIICLVGKNEETNKRFVKALKRVEQQYEEANCRYYKGNVLADQVIDSDGNLFILGNVMKGGTVAANKDVIVLGELNGEVYAGMFGDPGHMVYAVRMNPTLCKIGSLELKNNKKGLFDKRKDEPCIVYEKDGALICEIADPENLINVTSI